MLLFQQNNELKKHVRENQKVVLLKAGYALVPEKSDTELGQLVIGGIIGEPFLWASRLEECFESLMATFFLEKENH